MGHKFTVDTLANKYMIDDIDLTPYLKEFAIDVSKGQYAEVKMTLLLPASLTFPVCSEKD